MKKIFKTAVLSGAALAACFVVQAEEKLSDDDIRWREKIGFNPQVHASVENSSDAEVFARAPYAYYPYSNELEVVFDLAAAVKLLPADSPKPSGGLNSVEVMVFPVVITQEEFAEFAHFYAPNPKVPPDLDKPVACGKIPLDGKGRGHGIFKIPDMPDGNYRVVYEYGGARLTASRTFRRSHFEWERCRYGTEHKVYAPFTPVAVDGNKVSVADRTYAINSFGLFDSVISKGRELLAEPMKLVAEKTDGSRIAWKAGKISGKAVYADLAEFKCSTESEIGTLQSEVSIEEDGCAKIAMTLTPVTRHQTPIRRAWLEIALKETEAPLCHMVGMNSMRHNYAGNVPRGGKITWLNQPWRPARFEVQPFEGETPASYQVWEANNQMHWGGERWNFAPYVWLGAEERGLAWFGDDIGGYSTDGKTSLQRLFIEPGKVVLRVEFIQQPVTLESPRRFVFGLQASPTKPMRPDWRGYSVPGGGGMSVVVWGGFNCADKVPANKDWTIVDKVMEGRKTGKPDFAWFAEYAKTHKTISGSGGAKAGRLHEITLEEAKANGQPWLTALNHFVAREAGAQAGVGTTVYYEEHQTSGNYPDVAEFMDEWSDSSFARYRYFDYPKTWGPECRSANPESYRDFAVFYANEWMKRGVGIYYDNTYPMVDRNPEHFRGRGITWSSSIWGHRDYYKRVWKRSRELMESGASPLPLHTVGHVTNCQVLPYTTWWDATLGVESPGQWQPDKMPSAEEMRKCIEEWSFVILPGPNKDTPGQALPYPPDYLRAMEMGRMAGLIPHYRHLLRSEDAVGGLGISFGATDQGREPELREHRLLSDAAMGIVHEIRGGASGYEHPKIGGLRRSINDFGYGKPGVKVYNYWDEDPFAAKIIGLGNPKVKWLAMTRDGAPFGMILLQSYSPEASSTSLIFPEGKIFIDAETRETFQAGADGSVEIKLPADYGTRLFYVLRNEGAPKLLSKSADTLLLDDFELGLGFNLAVHGKGFDVVKDTDVQENHVLRIVSGHPSQNVLVTQGLEDMADYELSFKFRIPAVPAEAGKGGLLHLGYRDSGSQRFYFGLGYEACKDGKSSWTVSSPVMVLDGGKNEGYGKTVAASPVEASVDTEWHTLAIKVQGPRHTIAIDGKTVFEGEDERNLKGPFTIAPGWGWNKTEYVEIDEISVKSLKQE